jgi:hypothetical protein
MNSDDRAAEVSLAEQGRLIAAVERFEADWRAGRRPRIEDALAGADPPRRSRWLRELIRLELELRARAGELPRPGDYLRRFADRTSEIAAAFADLDGPGAFPGDGGPRGRPRGPDAGRDRPCHPIMGDG